MLLWSCGGSSPHTLTPTQLESFEIRHGVTSSATVPRKELAAKVVRSGKYAQLGFPTPADVMAADRVSPHCVCECVPPVLFPVPVMTRAGLCRKPCKLRTIS